MEKQKICLIIPPSVFLLDEKVFIFLGILKIAAVLELEGYIVDVLDLSGIQNYEDVIEEYLFNKDTKLFGLTATTPQIPQTVKIAELIRKLKLYINRVELPDYFTEYSKNIIKKNRYILFQL